MFGAGPGRTGTAEARLFLDVRGDGAVVVPGASTIWPLRWCRKNRRSRSTRSGDEAENPTVPADELDVCEVAEPPVES